MVRISALTTITAALLSTLNFSFPLRVMAQGLFDMPGQEHIDRGTMDRNRRSRGQNKTLWGTSDDDSNNNVTYAVRTAKVTTAGNRVNIRKGPGLNYEIVTQVNDGRYVGAIGNTADREWTQLKCGDCPPGEEIWIFSDFIEMVQ